MNVGQSTPAGATGYTDRERHLLRVEVLFSIAGSLSSLVSVYPWFFRDEEQGLSVGLWVPSLWSLGTSILATESRSS